MAGTCVRPAASELSVAAGFPPPLCRHASSWQSTAKGCQQKRRWRPVCRKLCPPLLGHAAQQMAAVQPSPTPCPQSQGAVPPAAVVAAAAMQMQGQTQLQRQTASQTNSQVAMQQDSQQQNCLHQQRQQPSMCHHGMQRHLQQHARPAGNVLLSTSRTHQPCTTASGPWWMLQQHMCCM